MWYASEGERASKNEKLARERESESQVIERESKSNLCETQCKRLTRVGGRWSKGNCDIYCAHPSQGLLQSLNINSAAQRVNKLLLFI